MRKAFGKDNEYFKIIEDEMTDETREFLANSTDAEKIAKGHELLDEIEVILNTMFDKNKAT